MKLIVEIPDEEYESYALAITFGMGSTAIKRILDGKPYEEHRWIPVTERLPEKRGLYLVTKEVYGKCVTIEAFYPNSKDWSTAIEVTAWMPLPKPYEEGAEE